MKLRILGSGTSSGVPRIGPDWGDCDPLEPRNRRMRASILVETATTRVLVDTTPDMRAQLIAAEIDHVDAVIWTHDHADHCHGIDDLRQLYHAKGQAIIAYARADVLESLQRRFEYAFYGKDGYPPMVEGRVLPDAFTLGDLHIAAVDQPHGNITSAGVIFTHNLKKIVYSTDFNDFTPEMAGQYKGADIWVVDALRRRPHPTHCHLDKTFRLIGEVKPQMAVLTHMDQSMDYATLLRELPAGVLPGYDGMEMQL